MRQKMGLFFFGAFRFPKQKEKKLIPFFCKKGIQSNVVLLADIHQDIWIQAIDSSWFVAIPATLINNN
jgi:hypothetical protein